MRKQEFKKGMCKVLALATLATAIPFNAVGVMAAEVENTFPLAMPERPTKENLWTVENVHNTFDLNVTGYGKSLLISKNNTVKAAGSNGASGGLGDGSTSDSQRFIDVKGEYGIDLLGDVVSVSSGNFHSLALKSDGTVWAWGDNFYGQLGDGTETHRTTPVKVKNINNIVKIYSGEDSSAALDSDGNLWYWGVSNPTDIPVMLEISNIADISLQRSSALILKKDGTIWQCKRLGHKNQEITQIEEYTDYFRDAIDIASGESHYVALKKDGTVWAWGSNNSGQLGDGSVTKDYVFQPQRVHILTDVVNIEAGGGFTLALKKDGTVWAWGESRHSQLGEGSYRYDGSLPKPIPVQVKGENGVGFLTDVVSIQAGVSEAIAIKKDGTVWAWGRNYKGQLGDGTSERIPFPKQIFFAGQYTGPIGGGTTEPTVDVSEPTMAITPSTVNYTNRDIELTIQADDGENGSGVKSITLPNGEVVNSVGEKDLTLSTKYTVSRNGIYEFTVEDNSGNVSTKSIIITNIDKEKPSTPYLTKVADKLVLTPSTDNLSGVDKYMYSLNNGVWTQFTGDLNLSNFVTGEHTIRVKAVDKATNESDISSLSFTVESVSNPELDNATDLVEKAENTKDQGDVDNARDAVNQLPEGPEKDDLNDRLDKIQDEINAEKEAEANLLAQAIAAVEKAESTKSQVDISTAYGLVNQLKPGQDKTDLLARLDALKSQIELDNALAKAIAAVVKAEETKNQLYVDVAYTLVERLPESPEKTELLRRLDELQLQIYYEADLRKATAAVVRAEKTKTEGDIDAAYVLVNALKDGQDKTDLLNRLQAIKDDIQAEEEKQEQLLAEAIAAVEKAESTKSQIDVDNARIKVNALPIGIDKTELTNRLNAVQAEIDYALKVADAIRSVEKAEESRYTNDISNAYKKVNGLRDGETKTDLLGRLKALEEDIAQKAEEVRIAKEAIKAVERAEGTKKDIDIEDAKKKVALVKDDLLREELEERLANLQLDKEKEQEVQSLKEAERLVRLAEIFKRNPHLLNARTAVNKLNASEEKLDLTARLDKIEGKSGAVTEEMKKEMSAEASVENAEKYKYATLIRKAIQAVDSLPESAKKTELQARIDRLLDGNLPV